MRKKQLAEEVIKRLKNEYPDSVCTLDSHSAWQLLVSVRLAAQCTDKRVNETVPALFAKYDTPEKLAKAKITDIEKFIKPCGLFRTKANDIKNAAIMLIDKFGGRVPDTMDELLSLPGVGRKTANLILSDIYGQPAIVADTHCIRISNKLGLTTKDCGKDPYKVEMALKKVVEPAEQASLCHRFVHFGRDICTARSPQCGICPLNSLCEDYIHKA